MKVTVINGNTRHGSTWHCMDLLKQELSRYEAIEVTEFYMPRDMPHFCKGCFSCFLNGEETCPHAESIDPIVKAMEEADLVVLTSPVYGMDVSGQLKALLDHLCFMWLSHRPNPKMFNTVGLSISTTAGAGLSHTTKTMQNSLKFWGLKKRFALKEPVSAMKWDEVPTKNKAKIRRDVALTAKKIAEKVSNIEKQPSPLFRRFMFKMMLGMMKKNTWNPTDRNHWEAQGWLSGEKPF
ncbi:flavodoxin family protein [Acetobacterium bakii]|uniref:NADPH-dependent FMN reductase-like domain-containing protein n=1 Tax=Acetobacterium bakii TaxID=52689 RepID=A0A0L6U495_9FIRM|nr:NAD(P)H-dependent oxidoreductase [Acetobacterium bakii]KNZ42625.1 hypothetical protein AKG39_05615 [Acetobacterium bakii]